MKNLNKLLVGLLAITVLLSSCASASTEENTSKVSLTLIPPSKITNKVNLDIRGGIVNESEKPQEYEVTILWNNEETILFNSKVTIDSGETETIKVIIPTNDRVGKHDVVFIVKNGDVVFSKTKKIEIIDSNIRSTREISGAWAGIYHWSETEGKHWNKDIQKMEDSHWKELTRSMNKLDMNIMVIQEVFRNEEYVGKHTINIENYSGKAFYPSTLYPDRMDIAAKDPIEAILSEADKLGMNIFLGVGMFAWFDFTPESLEWHKLVAKELWDMYGQHESFYGFYVSEESGGGLDNWEETSEMQRKRKDDIVHFFKEFKKYCTSFAPSKPIMLATNSFDVPTGMDTYPALLEHLDILCPFGFARMPEGDITGKEAADMLQEACDAAGSHLWFDLEAFLFNPDSSLYPRPIEEIIHDLNMFDNFEKILCYQFPGVFNDPEMSVRIGEERTVELFKDYQEYLSKLKSSKISN